MGMLFDRNALLGDLRNGVVHVEFRKEDGTVVRRKATLKREYLPAEDIDENGDAKPNQELLNEDAAKKNIIYWDIGAGGWRSFRLDRLLTCQAAITV